jgi:hypothetical protein
MTAPVAVPFSCCVIPAQAAKPKVDASTIAAVPMDKRLSEFIMNSPNILKQGVVRNAYGHGECLLLAPRPSLSVRPRT